MATKIENFWMAAVAELGCIVCRNTGHGFVPCSVHHILKNGRRNGHLNTIGLCPTHHDSRLNNPLFVSVHPWKHEFEARYGTQAELLKQTQELICRM